MLYGLCMVTSIVLSMMLSFAPSARAESWVVLVQAKDKVSPTLVEAVQKSAKKSVMRLNKRNKWVNPPEVALDEMVMAAGCAQWDLQCAGTVAGMLGATRALVVELSTLGDGVQTTLSVVNKSGRKIRSAEATLLADRLEDDIPFFVQSMLAKKPATRLSLESEPKGATVYIDGKKKGLTPLMLENVIKAGKHTIKLKLKDQDVVEKKLMVAVGTQTTFKHTYPAKEPKVAQTDPKGTSGSTGSTGTTSTAPDETTGGETSSGTSGSTSTGSTGTGSTTETEERVIGVVPPPEDEGGMPMLMFAGIGVGAAGVVTMVSAGAIYAGLWTYRESICVPNSTDGEGKCTLQSSDPNQTDHFSRVELNNGTLETARYAIIAAEVIGAGLVIGGVALATTAIVLDE